MFQEYLLVDGYNIIFAWNELNELSKRNLEAARIRLADILCNYQGFRQNEVILVFDAYKVKGNPGTVIHYHNIDIVYTKEAETADQFIELVAEQMGRQNKIRVATSDALEQLIIMSRGAVRMSARELKIEIEETEKAIRETYQSKSEKKRNSLMDNLPKEMADYLEILRLTEDE